VEADLYVKYIPKKDEYRVHIFDNEIIDVQKKMMCEGWDDPDWQVRNVANGFIYGRIGIVPPSCVLEVAMETFRKFDLDFGAVDVIYTENIDKAYALEINTAPGLEGQTVISYAKELVRYL
jgi:glutathione synthase/RimK-type ligase-like ATP-grasp enzyme